MIAYNKTWLANLRLQTAMKKELKLHRITNAEFKAIAEKYPVGFYTPGVFVRVGLFILTSIVVSFANGLFSLLLHFEKEIEGELWIIFLGLLSYATLEIIVKIKHYRSGVDDALLFITGCLLASGIGLILWSWSHGDYLTISFIVFLLTLYLSMRFSDMLVSAICCEAFFAFIFFGWTRIVPNGLTTVPFIIMLVSAGVYWMANVYNKRLGFINYQNCLVVAQVVSLVVLYAAGNYYIVQTLRDELNRGSGKSIPFGFIFWIWTITLPFMYVGFGIGKKNVILLRTGLLLIAAAAITFRNYYHVLSIGTALTIAGAIMLGIAYGIMKYLKTPKHGFTCAEPDDADLMDRIKVESLIVAQTFSNAPAAPANDDTKFGGGDFGGGGSSGTF